MPLYITARFITYKSYIRIFIKMPCKTAELIVQSEIMSLLISIPSTDFCPVSEERTSAAAADYHYF
jgi:hypothetical protein